MEIGLYSFAETPFDTETGRQLDAGRRIRQLLEEIELAKTADELGFDTVWTVEHHFTPYTMVPNPLQLLTYIAGVTENVDVGTMVVVLPWHNPVRVAEDVNMLDALLGETLTADEYRESRHCLHRSAYRRVDIINQEFLLFSKRGTYYLNRLKRKCPGLRRNLLLTFRMTTNSVCRSDLVYASDRIDLHRGINSSGIPNGYRATCHLGEFEQIGEQQALALKAAL